MRNPCQSVYPTEINDISPTIHPEAPGRSSPPTVSLQKNDHIRYKIRDDDDWYDGHILGRAGKASTATKYWYNICDSDGTCKSINMEKLAEWKKVDTSAN